VLGADVVAEADVPGFARSAMDGFAVRGEETFGASDYEPIALEVVGESFPGRPYAGEVGPGGAVKIMTGAPLPKGADAVVRAEVCRAEDRRVEITEPVPPRKNIGAIGEDIRNGDRLLSAGRRLRPQDVGVLSSVGIAEVPCVGRPRVALVITGDELLPAGTKPRGAHIADSNSVMLAALVERDGGVTLPYEILPDRPERIRSELTNSRADVILVSGGSSVGQEDHAPRLVASLGRLDFHGVAMRPSSPAGVGRLPAEGRERFVFLLPGNPVSCLCAYEFFAGPTIRASGGRSWMWPHKKVSLPLARKISSEVGRVDYVRVAIEDRHVIPLATSGASILSSTVRAAGCVIVSRDAEGMPEGATVDIILYDEDLP
jgi:molybdopterin molybdotransferase